MALLNWMSALFANVWLVWLLTFAASQSIDIDVGCTERSYRYGAHCFNFMGRQQYSFAEANELCSSVGGVLATPWNKESYLFLKKLAIRMQTHGYWMGITDEKQEGKWVYKSDDTDIGFKLWYQREPNNANLNEDCAIINLNHGNQWNDISCDSKELYICQFLESSINCQKADKINSKCFWLSSELKSFREAEVDCRQRGGLLVEVRSEDENTFIRSTIYNDRWWMKSFTDNDVSSIRSTVGYRGGFYWTWLGINFKDSTQRWTTFDNGTEITFSQWATGEPNNKMPNQEKCVAFSWEDWIDVSCNFEANVICALKVNRNTFSLGANA